MKAYIKQISYYLPQRILSNEKLVEEFPEWTVDKIASKVGVNNRHVAGEQETALDMAVAVANNLFAANPDIQREDVDFVLFCTQSPDYFSAYLCLFDSRTVGITYQYWGDRLQLRLFRLCIWIGCR